MLSRCSFLTKVAFVLSCIVLVSLPVWGQTFYGAVAGTVTDASNAAISGATVALVNNGTGDRRTATTSTDGAYRFVNLVPGNYRIEIEQPGFKRYTRSQITVEVE